jgi:hypothetical protein
MELKDLIKNLKNLTNENKVAKIVNVPLEELFYHILYEIAQLQAPDTSHARMLIIKKCAEKLNKNYEELIESYEYWWNHGYPENINRTPQDVADSKVTMKDGLYTWSSTDAGIYAQEFERRGSDNVKDMNGNDRVGNFPQGHITQVANKYDDNVGEFSNIINKKIEDILINYILTGVIPK